MNKRIIAARGKNGHFPEESNTFVAMGTGKESPWTGKGTVRERSAGIRSRRSPLWNSGIQQASKAGQKKGGWNI